MKTLKLQSTVLLLAACVILQSGCGPADSKDAIIGAAHPDNMARLVTLYTLYQSRNPGDGYMGPSDEEDFKEFVQGVDEKMLARIAVDKSSLDDVFMGDRDGEPYKIRYGVQGSARGCAEAAIFESVGVDGKRMVGFLNTVKKEVDSSEYDQLFSGEISAPVATPGRDR